MEPLDRAGDACERSMDEGKVSEAHVRDVLRRSRDGARFVRFLGSEDLMVRTAAARIVAQLGPLEELAKAALVEKDRGLLLDMMRLLAWKNQHVEMLVGYLESQDGIVKDAAMEMFRRAGKAEYLFPMVFDEDDETVERARRYLHEKGKG
jgi:hypothetical protein